MLNHKLPVPICKKKLFVHKEHSLERRDNYYWLRERESKEVIQYLEKENAYCEKVMEPTEELQEKLYKEMRERIQEKDSSAPVFENGYWYYTRTIEGGEYYILCRKKESLDNIEEILLDVEALAKEYDYYDIADYEVSEDNMWLAFLVDTVSRKQYRLYLKNLQTQKTIFLNINNISGESGIVWDNTSTFLYYITKNSKTLLSEKVYRYNIITKKIELLYTEKDVSNYLSLSKSKDKRYIFFNSESTIDNEWRFIDLVNVEKHIWQVFAPRKKNILYYPESGESFFYILTNKQATNFKLMRCEKNKRDWDDWQEFIAEEKDVLLSEIEVMKKWIVMTKRTQAKIIYTIINLENGEQYDLPMEEEICDMTASNNVDFDTDTFRYTYNSLTTPSSEYTFNLRTKQKKLLKQKVVLGGFEKDKYESERIWVKVRDGVKVPISLVYKKGLQKAGNNPLLLYGYGSYGYSIDPYFSSMRLSLLDRGFIFVIAHIRGGQELGRQWYENGKLLNKKNTFFDFIDVGEYLIEKNYTSHTHLYAMGGSAGGLLMGAILNFNPNLWHGVIADVPFVDVITTMFDETIPLTTNEFDEWGNPKDKKYFDYMMTYSPYDNVGKKIYPHLLVTTGLHDSQVQYWEPAKWVAKIRELNPNSKNFVLLKTEMSAGHSGVSGRFEYLKDIAIKYAFLLALEYIEE